MFNAVRSFFKSEPDTLLPLHAKNVQDTASHPQAPQQPTPSISSRADYPQSAKRAPRWIPSVPASPQENTAAAKRYLADIRAQALMAGHDEDIAVISALLGNEHEEGKLNRSENKEAAVTYWNALADAMLEHASTKRVVKDMEQIRQDLSPTVRAWLQYQPALPPEDSDSE